MKEAVVTKCRKCTAKQKKNFYAISVWYPKNEPDKWDAFVKKAFAEYRTKNLLDNVFSYKIIS